jgi:tripartite-type tricarboxylate transporter receptor subunit TctC
LRHDTILLALAALLVAAPAFAQGDYPDRPVRIVVPFPAGSATDIVSRLMAQKFGAKFGQQFIVENRSGTRPMPSWPNSTAR